MLPEKKSLIQSVRLKIITTTRGWMLNFPRPELNTLHEIVGAYSNTEFQSVLQMT